MKTEMILFRGSDQYKLDLTDDIDISLNYLLDDFFALDKRRTPFSKSIELPGTRNNNVAFNHLYKVNSASQFDTRIKHRIIIKNSGLILLDGNLVLDKVREKLLAGVSEILYEVSCFGQTFSFFDAFGDLTIRDLDFSRYDHFLSAKTIAASWPGVSSINSGIPKVTDNGPSPSLATQTIDYTSPIISVLSSVSFGGINRVDLQFASNHSLSVNDEVFVIGSINTLVGCQTIIDVPAADRITLAMAYANLDTTVLSAGAWVEKRTWNAIGYWYPLIDYGHYQKTLTGGQLIAGTEYKIITYNGDDFLNVMVGGQDHGAGAAANAAGVSFVASDGITSKGFPLTPTDWSNGSELITPTLKSDGGTLVTKEETINNWSLTDFIPHIFVREVWTKMFELIGYQYTWTDADSQLFRRLVMPMDAKFDRENTGSTNVSSEVIMNDWLPSMKLKEFFISICNMFNLIILPAGSGRVRLVNRGDFFSTIIKKRTLDVNKEIEVEYANSILPGYYHFKYKDSSDFYNLDYNKDIGDINNTSGYVNEIDRRYGDKYISTGNEFATGNNIIELFFEPTILAGPISGSPGHEIYVDSDKSISVCYYADEAGTTLSRKPANRILIASMRGTANRWSLRNQCSLVDDVDGSGGTFPGTFEYHFNARIFPYAGHIDNVFDAVPSHDLNFNIPIGQYFPYMYDPTKWSQACLIERYWNKYLIDIVSVDAKRITAFVRWSAKEIYELDFSELNRIGDFVCKLSKISDWNVNGDGVCRTEFLLKT